jgi:hypothetical protein
MNGDRRILVGVQPCELECRFASYNVEQKQPQGAGVHS